ncbi:MAG: thymidine kinase [Crocinitomicaceae bacterium TMED16]|nr:thymidine kinase [Crocinitomicaceae bacterium]OUT71746.1 MAG: thymidine kinase [Crocinitomicaceae bacterium TMED16]|tara:strand:+ start:832 stop:1407 length:576 start_codon:yes stop_codon:yes gene_type:complete
MFLEQFPIQNRSNGWIEVICGSMFSGKTEELIRRLRRAEFAKQDLILFKPSVDIRYSEKNVVSHRGTEFNAVLVSSSKEILDTVKNQKVVAIDEAQFFDDQLVEVASELAGRGIRVILAGLDMDYKGTPFGPMPALLASAEYVSKVHAICVSCGNLAQFSNRLVSDTDQVMLGAVEEYRPLCRSCFNKSSS